MKTKLLGLMALVTLLGMSQAGAETLVGTTTDATGIDGLVVGSLTYNVTFENASYDTVYPSAPTFLGNSSGAEDAASAIESALNSLGVTALTGISGDFQVVEVPYDVSATSATSSSAYCNDVPCPAGSWSGLGTSGGGDLTDVYTGYYYTTFLIAASSPLPAALPLFATGLGALGLLGWRRKRKALAA
jgi:hypothetical protein